MSSEGEAGSLFDDDLAMELFVSFEQGVTGLHWDLERVFIIVGQICIYIYVYI